MHRIISLDDFEEFWGVEETNETQSEEPVNNLFDTFVDSLQSCESNDNWWNSLSAQNIADLRKFETITPNEYFGHTLVKNGKLTLTGLLQSILYCDQVMELEVIVDELFKRGWNEEKAENVVLMRLRKCPLFDGNKQSGFSCPTSSRRYFKN